MKMINENDIKVYFGLELETELNAEIIRNLETGDYHAGEKLNKYWDVERDGSLECNDFDDAFNCEFVSKVFKLKDLDKVLNSLFYSLTLLNPILENSIELYKFMSFNESCGSHIHFSIYYKGHIVKNKFISYEFLKSLRLKIKRQIKKNFSEDFYKTFLKQYYRSYAKRISSKYKAEMYINRYYEFNLSNQQKALEYRSFNLLPVTTKAELYKIFNLTLKTIEEELIKEFLRNFEKESLLKIELGSENQIMQNNDNNENIKLISFNDKEINKEVILKCAV